MSRARNNIIRPIFWASFVAFAIATITVSFFLQSRIREVKVASVRNERGELLASAFAGIKSDPQLLRTLKAQQNHVPKGGCAGKPSLLSRITDSLHLTVHAQDNGCDVEDGYSTDCVDHYMFIQNVTCYCYGNQLSYNHQRAEAHFGEQAGTIPEIPTFAPFAPSSVAHKTHVTTAAPAKRTTTVRTWHVLIMRVPLALTANTYTTACAATVCRAIARRQGQSATPSMDTAWSARATHNVCPPPVSTHATPTPANVTIQAAEVAAEAAAKEEEEGGIARRITALALRVTPAIAVIAWTAIAVMKTRSSSILAGRGIS
jgi:hypothetical protein